jgi:hypothetical protein
MAWLYQRGKKWWIGYYDENGERVRKSISDSKEVAELTLKRIEADVKHKNVKILSIPESTLEAIGKQLASAPEQERLATYSGVRNAVNVRELFVRIYDRLGFEVLKSQDEFPNYVLSGEDRPIRAHAVVRSSDFKKEGLDYLGCDSIICWVHDWDDAPIPVLVLSQHFNFLG